MKALALLFTLLPLLFTPLALEASAHSEQTAFSAAGVSVVVPRGWHATVRRLTAVVWPPQRLAIASYPLRQKRDSGCGPTNAVAAMPKKGAFIFLLEYAGTQPPMRTFPRRPKHFRLTGFASYECFGPSYNLRFRERGRFFQIHVYLGRRAGAAVRASVLRTLGSLQVKPR